MGKRHLRFLATGLALLAVAFYVFQKVQNSPEWKNFDGHKFLALLLDIRIPELFAAILLMYSTYLLRSLRWREFLLPVKRTSVSRLLAANIVGFGAVAIFGRAGELVRPYLIAHHEDLPVSGQLAVWMLERFCDGVTIVLLVSAAVFFSGMGEDTGGQLGEVLVRMRRAGIILMTLTVAGVALLVLYERRRGTWEPRLMAKLGFLPAKYVEPVRRNLDSFARGLAGVRSARAWIMGAIYSLLVWLAVGASFLFTLRALGPPVDELDFPAAMLVLGFAIAGSAIMLPGIGGGTQVFTIFVLTEIYGVPPEVATGAGLVLWGLLFLVVVPPAVVLGVRDGLTWNKLRLMTRGESSP